jgi:hypothetical protein
MSTNKPDGDPSLKLKPIGVTLLHETSQVQRTTIEPFLLNAGKFGVGAQYC